MFALEPSVTVSVVSLKFDPNSVDTVEAVGLTASSRSVVSVALPLDTGASFTALTLWLSTTLDALYAVAPPFTDTLTPVAPSVTVALESISLARSVGALPFQSDAGTNRNFAEAPRVSELVSLTVLIALQEPPVPSWYCQAPFDESAV